MRETQRNDNQKQSPELGIHSSRVSARVLSTAQPPSWERETHLRPGTHWAVSTEPLSRSPCDRASRAVKFPSGKTEVRREAIGDVTVGRDPQAPTLAGLLLWRAAPSPTADEQPGRPPGAH